MNKNEIVDFGKYKGQPFEVMSKDSKYCDWLSAQTWFKEKYSNTYNMIINNFGEPSETPEHNKLQAMFLDDNFCIDLGLAFYKKDWFEKEFNEQEFGVEIKLKDTNYSIGYRKFEDCGVDVSFDFEFRHEYIGNMTPEQREIIRSSYWFNRSYYKKISDDGMHNQSTITIDDRFRIGIEIKPSISDDYPAILRQIKNIKRTSIDRSLNERIYVLVYDEFTAIGATKEQVEQIFRQDSIRMISIGEIQKFKR